MSSKTLPLFALAAVTGSSLATPVFVPIDITTGTGSTATQSTPAEGVTPPGSGFPERAIDGNLGNFTHTSSNDPDPSLTVDFGRDETFNQILVYNRTSCCADRLADITVQVFDNAGGEVYNSGPSNVGNELSSPSVLVFELPAPVNGRSITVSRDGASNPAPGILSVGELQIGTVEDVILPPGSDLTHSNLRNITTSQDPTSASPPGGGVPGNGIDGNLGNFTHTNANLNVTHQWQVDFGEEMLLEQVDLRNRSNCCGERLRDITVSVLDAGGTTVVSSEVLNPGNALSFNGTNQPGLLVDLTALNGGSPVRGQTVVVSRTPDPSGGLNGDDGSVISLGEVFVFGSTAGPGTPFEITEIQFDGTDVTLTWNSRPGASYTIFRTADLGSWLEEIEDNYESEGDTTTFVDDSVGGASTFFYRILQE